MRSALFWDITQRRVVILYRRFGTTYWTHLIQSRRMDKDKRCSASPDLASYPLGVGVPAGSKAATNLHLEPRLGMRGAIPVLPLYALMASKGTILHLALYAGVYTPLLTLTAFPEEIVDWLVTAVTWQHCTFRNFQGCLLTDMLGPAACSASITAKVITLSRVTADLPLEQHANWSLIRSKNCNALCSVTSAV
jgi:hypothetical protein